LGEFVGIFRFSGRLVCFIAFSQKSFPLNSRGGLVLGGSQGPSCFSRFKGLGAQALPQPVTAQADSPFSPHSLPFPKWGAASPLGLFPRTRPSSVSSLPGHNKTGGLRSNVLGLSSFYKRFDFRLAPAWWKVWATLFSTGTF